MKILRLILTTLAVLVAAAAALAQRTLGFIADPITLADLRLGITLRSEIPFDEAIWAAVEKAHDRYLEAYRELERSAVDPALAEWSRTLQLAVPEDLKTLVQRVRAVDARLASLDATLFDQALVALGEESRRAVDGLRSRRSAERVSGVLTLWNRASFEADTADRVLAARLLRVDERARLRELAFDYDRQQAALRRRFADASIERALRMNALNRNVPIDWSAPDAREQYEARLAEERAAHPEFEDSARKITELRTRFLADAMRELPFDARRELHARLASNDPWGGGARDPYSLEPLLRHALRLKELDDATRQSVRKIYEDWAADDERLQREYDAAIALTTLGGQGHFDAMNAMRDAAMKIGSEASAKLVALLGGKRYEECGAAGRAGPIFDEADARPIEELTALERRAGGGPAADHNANARYRSNATVPPPSADLYVAWMGGPTETERAIIAAIIADRERAWTESIAPALVRARAALVEMRGARWQEPRMENLDELLRGCMAAYDAADAQAREIGEALRAALPATAAEAIDAATLERRVSIQVDDESLMAVTTSWEYELLGNLPRAVRAALPAEATRSVRAALVAEGDLLVAAARARRAAATDLGLEELQAIAEVRAAPPDAANEVAERGKAGMLDRERRGVVSRRASTDAFRASLARLSASLSAADARALRLAYERDAYPELFFDRRDPTPIAALLQRGLAADDQRRVAIDEAVAAHAARRASQLFAWIDACRANPVFGREDQFEQANIRRAREFFDRNEIHTRLVFALRRIVTPEEIRTVPALERYEALVARVPSVWHQE